MTYKSLRTMLKGVSVLPALLVAPALAEPGIGFVDGYVTSVAGQLHNVLNAQNENGFNVGTITVGLTEGATINDQSLRYGVANRSDAKQYVHMTDVSVPDGVGGITLDIPVYNSRTKVGMGVIEIGKMQQVLGNQIYTAGAEYVTPSVADVQPLLGTAVNANLLGGRTWLLSAVSSALSTGSIDGGYLCTGDNFVVDGNYGNMVGTLLDTYEDSLKNILDGLAPNIKNMTEAEVAERISYRLGDLAYKAAHNGEGAPTKETAVDAGDLILKGMFGVDATTVAHKWMNGELKKAISSYVAEIKDELADLNGLKLNVGDITINGGNVTVLNTVDITSTGILAINGGNVVNNGTLNINAGTVSVANDATFDLGANSTVVADTMNIGGTVAMTLADDAGARISATSIVDDGGVLDLTIARAGEYRLFGQGVFAGDVETGSLYNIQWKETSDGVLGDDVNKILVATVKSTDTIAEENGISQEAATTVAGLASSSSEKLNKVGLDIQELLASDSDEDKVAVEQAVAALNPEAASVVQSATTSVQTTVTNLASSRMAMPTAGRSGGDVNLTGKGVWAQGLYNKSKMNDQFNGYTRGVALGMDGTINNDITVGAGYAFNHSDVASSSRDTDIDSNTVFVYGQYKPAEWYVNAVASYTWASYSEDGTVAGTPKTAEYDAGSFGLAVAGGYDFACGVTPELGLRYMHIGGDTYTDSLGTKNKLDTSDYLTAMLGAKYGFDIVASESMLFRPELRYAFKYDMLSDKSSATVTMPGVNAYTLDGDRLPRAGNEFGIGLTMKYNTMDLSLTYDIEVREDYTSQTGMLKFRYEF